MYTVETYRKHLLLKGSKIRYALEQLDLLAKDAIIFIVDEKDTLLGSLTDGDVRRGLLKGFNIDNTVENIIQPNPKFIKKEERDIHKIIEYRENNYRIIPVVNKNNKVINVINFSEIKSYLPVDAIIMAGGKGERLRPLTDSTPKPLLKIGKKTILEHNLDRLRLFGVDDFWITVHYLGNKIEEYIGDGHAKNTTIQYIYEKNPMGTIGSASEIKNFNHDYIIITNSDILTNLNYEHFFLNFLEQNADFSVVTIPYIVDVPYAVLETNNGHILNLKEKPTYTYYSNGGIYIMKKEVLEFIPIEKQYNATDLMNALIKANKKVISYPLTGYWLDIGKPEDYAKAKRDVLLNIF